MLKRGERDAVGTLTPREIATLRTLLERVVGHLAALEAPEPPRTRKAR
jgi:hypothetical protein